MFILTKLFWVPDVLVAVKTRPQAEKKVQDSVLKDKTASQSKKDPQILGAKQNVSFGQVLLVCYW